MKGAAGRKEEKHPLSVEFFGDMWRIATLIFFKWGKKQLLPTRRWLCLHSGLHRKVTFERTIARLFHQGRCYERGLRKRCPWTNANSHLHHSFLHVLSSKHCLMKQGHTANKQSTIKDQMVGRSSLTSLLLEGPQQQPAGCSAACITFTWLCSPYRPLTLLVQHIGLC